ncbi:hypothetical protein GQ53DRAFT_214785 [Thozetella sp. PMI_491]|nr:hypothetical protein GQ53DRAFT_214785 [Thozetella sp. PMI_491]
MATVKPNELFGGHDQPPAGKSKRRNIHGAAFLKLPPPPPLQDVDSAAPSTCLSPPPTPKRPTHRPRLSLGLRSNTGLTLHTNQAAFRQYTDYGSDGAMRSPMTPMNPRLYPEFLDSAEAPVSKRSSTSFFFGDVTPPHSPPISDFFDQEVVQMVLHNPATAQRLCKFAQGMKRAGNMEFLVKVGEYSRALSNLTSLVTHISSSFTSVAALMPLDLPPEVSSALQSNLRTFNKQMLPVLERLFRDAKASVEERIAGEIYPEFVKHQLAQCVKSSLSVSATLFGDAKAAYPGLGESFVLTDPLEYDNPIKFASDGFCKLAGYPRCEVLRQNSRFLQGMSTDRNASRRIREAVSLGNPTTQLVLNFRKDGTAFWNLVFVCPLQEQGRIRYFLGAQINVSENIGANHKDILRVLDFGAPTSEPADEESPVGRHPTPRKSLDRRLDREPGSHGRSNSQRRSQRSRFFKPFSRKSLAAQPRTGGIDFEDTARSSDATRSKANVVAAPIDPACPYPHLLVMRYVPAGAQTATLERRGSAPAPHLPVAFCSAGALALFGLEPSEKDAVLDQDIFSVLVDQASSPTINRTVRTTIRDKIAAGDTVSADLFISSEPALRGSSRQGRKNSIMSLSGRSREPSSATESDSSVGRTRKSETFERSAELVSSVFFGPRMRKVISHWSPLKDASGAVAWVVLVMSPLPS